MLAIVIICFTAQNSGVNGTSGNATNSTNNTSIQNGTPDITPPVVTHPANQEVSPTSPTGVTVNYILPTATDNVGVTSGPTCNPASGSVFLIGTTTVTCIASDAAGNTGQATFTVLVDSWHLDVSPTTLSSMQQGTSPTSTISVQVNSYPQVGPHTINVNLSMTGLPQGVKARFSSDQPFSSTPSGLVTFTFVGTSQGSAGGAGQTLQFQIDNTAPVGPFTANVQATDGSEVKQIPITSSITIAQVNTPSGISQAVITQDSINVIVVHPNISNNNNVVPTNPSTITVSTDKSSYSRGDAITISSKLSSLVLNHAVTIEVLNSFQNPVYIASLAPDSSGVITAKLLANGTLWQTSGTYTIKVEYNSTINNLTTFSFNSGNATPSANNVTQSPSVTTSQPTSQAPTTTPPTTIITPTQQDIQNIDQAKTSQTIAAEVNVGASQSTTTSIDNNVSVQTTSDTPDSLNVNVSAPNQTAPKVIMFNLPATTNVANLKELGVMYDGKLIQPAPNMDAILHAKSTDNPTFAIVVTQSGVQILVLIPHFSTHSITITNMSKVITPAIPEFTFAGIVLVIATLSIVLIPKIRQIIG